MIRAGLLLVVVGVVAGQDASRVARWREDLDFLAKELVARHKNAFAFIEEVEFNARVAKARERLAGLDDVESAGELVALAASLGDSHTNVMASSLMGTPRFPLHTYWLKDGLRVLVAPPEHADLLGAEVVKVGGLELPEVVARCRRLETFDNPSQARSRIPQRLVFPKWLRVAGIMRGDSLPLVFKTADGKERPLSLKPGALPRNAPRLRPKKAFVTARRSRKWFHKELLEEEGLLYVQYNRCASSKKWKLNRFTKEIVALCAAGKVRTIVIDVQYNGGGSSILGDLMFSRLAKHEPMKSKKNVFCVIGRRTFSSAILNAMRLKKRYGAVLVGEPTGGSPNHYGEIRSFKLPRSGFTVYYSTKRFEHGDKGATTITPDHRVELTLSDLRDATDPILQKIRTLVR